MSETAPATVAHTRQHLSHRRAETLAALLEAGLEEVREIGYDHLTIRSVAARAGVTHTTAYSYFSSKAHLISEIFWRRLNDSPSPTPGPQDSLVARVDEALATPAQVLSDDPALAQAALSALLSDDAEVVRLRNQIGTHLASRVTAALGPDAQGEVVDALLLAFSGAMLQAGMGYFDYSGVVRRMKDLARLLGEGKPR